MTSMDTPRSIPLQSRTRVLITGASAGIGAEFAAQYAARQADLILIARRRDKLDALAKTLTERFGVDAQVIVEDLADPRAPGRIIAELAARELNVDILINNAGYGVPGSFLSPPWRVHADFQQVLVNAVAELCYRLLPSMLEGGHGTIINVASLAGLMPGSAGHTLYGPCKAWLIKFSESLAFEVKPQGVRVLALCPGFTYTEFHDVNGMRPQVSRLPTWLWMSAESVVCDAIAAVERGAVVRVPGFINRALALSARVLPQRWLRAAIASRERDYRRVD